MNQHDIWQQPAFHQQTGSTRYMSLCLSSKILLWFPASPIPKGQNLEAAWTFKTGGFDGHRRPSHVIGLVSPKKKLANYRNRIYMKFSWNQRFRLFVFAKIEVDFSSISIVSEFATLDLRTRNHQKNMSDRFPSRSGFPMEKTNKTSSHMTSREIFWRHCERTSKKRLLVLSSKASSFWDSSIFSNIYTYLY